MENFIKLLISIVRIKIEGLSLNFDIFETGLFNIVLLLIILIYAFKNFFVTSLDERKEIILNNITDAENRLKEAKQRLEETQKQLTQVDIIIEQINIDKVTTKSALLESEIYEAKKDLNIKFSRALASFKTKEYNTFLLIKKRISILIKYYILNRLETLFESEKRIHDFMTIAIEKLEGGLLWV